MSFDDEQDVNHYNLDESDGEPSPSDEPSPSNEPPPLIGPAPRELPEELSGNVVKRFAGWTIAGLVIAMICAGIGWWIEGDYRELQEMRHYGEIVQAVAGNPLADEDGQWLDVAYEYGGEIYEVREIDVTEAQYRQVTGDPDGIIEMQVVIWPEEPRDPVSIAYIDDKSTFWFALFYGGGIAIVLISMLVGYTRMRRRKSLYINGNEVWADPATDVLFNNESRQYSLGVNYYLNGLDRFAQIRWMENNGPIFHQGTGKVLLLVDPDRPLKPHLPTDTEIGALRSASDKIEQNDVSVVDTTNDDPPADATTA